METKSNLRSLYLSLRNQMDLEDRLQYSQRIVEHILQMSVFFGAQHVLLYAPVGSEVNVDGLSKHCSQAGKLLYYPRVEGDDLKFYQVLSKEELKKGYQGILEPIGGLQTYDGEEDTCCIVPGSVFDEMGNRIGYGKGFYDRFLAQYSHITTIGCAYSLQMTEMIPKEPLDVPLSYVVTEKGWIRI